MFHIAWNGDWQSIATTGHRMTLRTKKLALAAYLKMHGAVFQGHQEGHFIFDQPENGKSIDDWQVEYLNSCCHKHDTELVNLRSLLPRRG